MNMVTKKINCRSVTYAGLIGDIFLSAAKLIAGILTGSRALVSDGIHSSADILASVSVAVGIALSGPESKKNSLIKRINRKIPPEKAEFLSILILAVFLFVTGAGMTVSGIIGIFYCGQDCQPPAAAALFIAAFAIVIKEILFFFTFFVASKEKNDILAANARHHQSDALSCLCSFFGILFSRLGFPFFDPLASALIGLMVIRFGVSTLKKAEEKRRQI